MAVKSALTKKFAGEYARASKKEKGRILDRLCEDTGWSRVNARVQLRNASVRKGPAWAVKRKPRGRKYSYAALKVLQEVWVLTALPCGKYMAAVMGDLLERLLRFRELGRVSQYVSEEVLAELVSMSGATIDRYLKPFKEALLPEAVSATKPSHILRSSIPLRTALDGFPSEPGYLEIDTVAHCGHANAGDYLVTNDATDPYTGWGVTRTVKNKAFVHMQARLEWIVAQYPLKVKGLDFDNGTEFLNWGLIAWADAKGIANITRSRPYQHNDNAHVEQRNGDWVRKHAFRYRYTTDAELAWLNELWEQVCFKKNYILPCKKAVGWEKTSSGRSKRVYDKPATPYRRLLSSGALDDKTAARLADIDYQLNPAKITRRINSIQQKLIGSAAQPTQVFAAAAG